jgi:hypothetical protein
MNRQDARNAKRDRIQEKASGLGVTFVVLANREISLDLLRVFLSSVSLILLGVLGVLGALAVQVAGD